ncbi:MAG: tRNA isopentenyl-2-thiomethyl-A-37 hydroxylase MiaE [Verrucomicrobiia bacterium]|jgi:tRNA-(ms[2]io[6]A)-hydroxylase
MHLWRETIPEDWLPKVLANLDAVLLDHCHLERKAAASALNLMKYPELAERARELNAIAQEELEHFNLLLDLLEQRGVPFGVPHASPWISGLMRFIRKGRREQVIDHLVAASLIEGRSCEKFQILAEALRETEPSLAKFYANLVASEGNHYAGFWLMACKIDNKEAHERLDAFLDLDAQLIAQSNELLLLH